MGAGSAVLTRCAIAYSRDAVVVLLAAGPDHDPGSQDSANGKCSSDSTNRKEDCFSGLLGYGLPFHRTTNFSSKFSSGPDPGK